jgi:Fe2+ transport system protein FeoA
MHEVTLNTLMPGEQATVAKLTTSPRVRQRLMEMGFIKGTMVEFIRSAPLGDPIEVKVKGYRLTLRKQEAESVFVHKNVP